MHFPAAGPKDTSQWLAQNAGDSSTGVQGGGNSASDVPAQPSTRVPDAIGLALLTELGLRWLAPVGRWLFGDVATAARLGQEGEAAVRAAANIGEKVPIQVAGRTRIPDGLTNSVLTEVKNVQSLSYTQQLRDFASYARQNGLRFDLWVRPTTELSGPLADEVSSGAINLRFIP